MPLPSRQTALEVMLLRLALAPGRKRRRTRGVFTRGPAQALTLGEGARGVAAAAAAQEEEEEAGEAMGKQRRRRPQIWEIRSLTSWE